MTCVKEMDALAVQAGRKLDAMIAEEVMGYEVVYRDEIPVHLMIDGKYHAFGEDSWSPSPHWAPSIDSCAARQVAKKMIRRGRYMNMTWYDHGTCVEFHNIDSGQIVEAWAKEPELAICRGVLLVVRGQL